MTYLRSRIQELNTIFPKVLSIRSNYLLLNLYHDTAIELQCRKVRIFRKPTFSSHEACDTIGFIVLRGKIEFSLEV
jgi:hypothetical protein